MHACMHADILICICVSCFLSGMCPYVDRVDDFYIRLSLNISSIRNGESDKLLILAHTYYICMYIYIYIRGAHLRVYVCIHIYIYIYMCIHKCVYIYIYICLYVYVYINVYIMFIYRERKSVCIYLYR